MIPYVRRVKYAFRTFFSILDHGRVPADVATALTATSAASPAAAAPTVPAAAATPAAPADRAVQLLALLQRDGRLLDFVMEDLSAYADAQVGAAARDVHGGCRTVLTKYFSIAPVMSDAEGHTVTLERGVDPARVKVIGNTTGQPPVTGILRHGGWEATRVDLPPAPTSGRSVLAPAEVEVQ